MILFLELGALNHPDEFQWEIHPDTKERTPVVQTFGGRPKYAYGPEFSKILGPFLAQTEIVVTDWGVRWPDVTEHPELPLALRERIVDVVWLRGLEDYRSDLVDLYGSIQFWLRRRRPAYSGPWLCIDRKFHSWPEAERQRLIVGGGLNYPDLRAGVARDIQMAYAWTGYSEHQGTG